MINTSSGANFATTNRFPHDRARRLPRGRSLEPPDDEGRLLYIDLVQRTRSRALNAAGPLASFGLARDLGYGDQITNRVVDALGDVSGGVRVHDTRQDRDVQIVPGPRPRHHRPTVSRTETFTGTVWGDPVLPTTEEHKRSTR